MSGPLVLQTKQEPSYYNEDALLGGAIGTLLGPLGILGGSIIGSLVGHKQMEKEFIAGEKIVSEPSLINKSAATGALLGNFIASLAFAVVAISIAPGILSSQAALALGAVATLGAGTIIGGVIGALSGKADMEKEYEQALAQQAHGVSRAASPGHNHSIEPQLAPDITQEKSNHFTQMIDSERSLTSPQQQIR